MCVTRPLRAGFSRSSQKNGFPQGMKQRCIPPRPCMRGHPAAVSVNATYVCEKGPSRSTVHRYEEVIARRWQALPLHMYLPLSNGESCQLLHAGRPGGSLGPDVRDAVLYFTSRRAANPLLHGSSQQGENTVGDVEIHIRAFPHRAVLLGAPGTLL
jgi:hypothetical protein